MSVRNDMISSSKTIKTSAAKMPEFLGIKKCGATVFSEDLFPFRDLTYLTGTSLSKAFTLFSI
jgi:hypothetical protein